MIREKSIKITALAGIFFIISAMTSGVFARWVNPYFNENIIMDEESLSYVPAPTCMPLGESTTYSFTLTNTDSENVQFHRGLAFMANHVDEYFLEEIDWDTQVLFDAEIAQNWFEAVPQTNVNFQPVEIFLQPGEVREYEFVWTPTQTGYYQMDFGVGGCTTSECIWSSGYGRVCPIESDLEIIKTTEVESTTVGGEITYLLEVTNNGPMVNNDIVVTDILSENLTYISNESDTASCLYEEGVLNCELDTLNVGETMTINLVVLVNETDGFETINNVASVMGSVEDPDETNNSDEVAVAFILGEEEEDEIIDDFEEEEEGEEEIIDDSEEEDDSGDVLGIGQVNSENEEIEEDLETTILPETGVSFLLQLAFVSGFTATGILLKKKIKK